MGLHGHVQLRRSRRSKGSWGMTEARHLLGICHHRMKLGLGRSIVGLVLAIVVLAAIVVEVLAATVVEVLVAIGSIGELGPDIVGSSGWLEPGCGGQRYRKWGSCGHTKNGQQLTPQKPHVQMLSNYFGHLLGSTPAGYLAADCAEAQATIVIKVT